MKSPDFSSQILESQSIDKKQNRQKSALGKVDPSPNDSKNCGGAVGALRLMVKVSELGVRAFPKNANTAALLTQG
ncbi:hypothetical protein [Helicobacter sp.]|uniref:hypothetical protein n=1 Tax=Helicobacter sp. TaxID=218 RepID=UPI0025BCFA63|nr:hypothetical protein [Helicobacter sp.]MBR2494945.1 hypothetical protein [Helicobacter sp.]